MDTRQLAAALILLAIADAFLLHQAFAPRVAKVEVMASGKGSAVLVTSATGGTLLYGTGSDASILRALGAALLYGDTRIDVVVVPTGATAERGGLAALQSRYQIGYMMTAQNALRGETINLGGITVEVLFPDRPLISGGAVVLALRSASSTIILDHASLAVDAWIKQLNEKSGLAAALVISTSTPVGAYSFR